MKNIKYFGYILNLTNIYKEEEVLQTKLLENKQKPSFKINI